MARIVCQVLHRKDRITFIWSDGVASFPPYHVEGDERASLLRIADQIHPRIANAGPAELAQLGYQLYKSLFRVDAGANAGAAIEARSWLSGLMQGNTIEAIEFLTDLPGRIAWNVLVEEIPATTDTAQRFWGTRFSLAAGRRVNPLRQNPVQSFPTQKWLVDPESTKRIGANFRADLAGLEKANLVIESAQEALASFARNAPDVVVVFARFADGTFYIGNETLTPAQLSENIEEAPHGNPDPLVVLLGLGDVNQQAAWQATIAEATTRFNGLVANETLVSAAKAFEVAQALVKRFVEGGRSLGEILRSVRSDFGGAGLALTAFCPPQLRVVGEGSAAFTPSIVSKPLPLPASPYRPFAAYDLADRALFFGRESDAIRGAIHCDRPDTVGVFLHGAPSVGKTSYLQAGLLPALEFDSIGYRVLRDRTPTSGDATPEIALPWLVLRSTSDLAGQFADALSCYCAQPLSYTTPSGQTVTVDLPSILRGTVSGRQPAINTSIQSPVGANGVSTNPANGLGDEPTPDDVSMSDLWIALRDNADLLGLALDAVTRVLPFELVIAIDQGEDLLTQVRKPHQEVRRQKAIAMLERLGQAAPRCKIIYTVRTQSLGRLLDLFASGHAPADWRSFYLRPLSYAEMGDALLYPTNREDIPFANVVPFQKYRFSFEPGATHQIASDVATYASENYLSPLPILQAVGALLYENEIVAKKQSVLRVVDMKAFGGIREALSKCFDAKIKTLRLSSAESVAMRDLLLSLCTSNADGTLDRDLIPASDLSHHWKASGRPVADIVNRAADELGLFEIQNFWIQGKQELIVSLAQDSLAQLGRKCAEEKSANSLARSKVMDLVIWLMGPLCFLSASLTYYFTRQGAEDPETTAKLEKVIDEAKKIHAKLEEQIALSRRPQYLGLLAQADQAMQTENALRARQLLLSQPATRSHAEARSKFENLRGFEWKHLWKRINGEQLLLAGHRGPVVAVAITPDGKRAATTSNDGTSQIWNLETRDKLATINGPKTPMHAIALSHDGKTLAVAGKDKNITLYDLAGLKTDFVVIDKAARTLEAHTDAVNGLAFGKDGNTLASASNDGTVILWDIAADKQKQTLKDHGVPVLALAFDADAKTLASVDAKGQLITWDGQSGVKRNTIASGQQTLHALAITADGKTIATAGVDVKLGRDVGVVRFWNAADGKETQPAIQHGAGVLSVAISGDGKTAVTGGRDHIVRVWDVGTGKEKHHYLGHLGAVLALTLTKDGTTLVTGSIDQSARLWHIDHPAGVDVITAHSDGVEALALDRNRMLLASAGKDGSVKLWDAKTSKALATLPNAGAGVTSLAFSSHKEKQFLAAGTRDDKGKGTIKIWQLEYSDKQGWQAAEKHTLSAHTKAVTAVAFHPNADKASLFLSGSEDATVILWDAEAGKEKEIYRGHKDAVRSVEFTRDGRTFVSAGKDGLVCLGETDRKDVRTVSDLHNGGIDALSLAIFATRGDHPESGIAMVSAGTDQMIRIVSVDPHERVANIKMEPNFGRFIRSHAQPVRALASSFDPKTGGLLASGSDDGAVKIFDFAGELFTLVGHRGAVRTVTIAPDQSFIASAGSDGTIRIWRTANVRIDK
ncbi:MAG: hypothetical protein EXS16_00245 [Gemmataceae bacterium]|nr:hypothetical protein [Gemmataceae bacterium]